MKVRLRVNVLLIIGAGYLATGYVFYRILGLENMTAEDAYDIVSAPLMTLIGGSLAIAKDLIAADDHPEPGTGGSGKQIEGKSKGE